MDRVTYLTTAPIPKLIREMSVPTIISMLVTSFYNLVDTAFVGRIDTQATAAVGISFSVMALIQAFSFLFGHGSGNYLSRRLGARDYEDAERMASTGFYSLLIGGVILSVLGVVYVTPLARFLGSTETILPYAVKYLRVIFIGAPFMMGSFCLNNHMRFQGSANIAMIGIVIGAILNIALDPLMIFTMNLGITGAALATIVSQMISFFLLLYLNLTRATIKVKIRKFTPNWHYYKNIFKGGIPSLVRQGIGSVATILLNKAAGQYGAEAADAAIAAMGVVTRITNFAYAALIGFGQGFQPVCGTNYGAKNYKRVKEAFFYCVKLGTIALVVLSVAGFVFAGPLVALFRDDPDVIRIGTTALRIQWVTFALNGYVVVSTMLLQTIGMPLKASIVAMARQGLFFVPLIVILPRIFGLLGVQSAQAVADLLSFFLAIPLCQSVLKTFQTDAG
ncbi:MAG: MATE family efflux transporter [Lachnospiraceae bacterium]|nr:MATE family efflux transporter [Lachnospiraceae bacterium]